MPAHANSTACAAHPSEHYTDGARGCLAVMLKPPGSSGVPTKFPQSNARRLWRAFPCTKVREQRMNTRLHNRSWPCVALARQGNNSVLAPGLIGKRCKSHAAKWRGRGTLVLDTCNHLVFLEIEKVRTQHVRGKDLL